MSTADGNTEAKDPIVPSQATDTAIDSNADVAPAADKSRKATHTQLAIESGLSSEMRYVVVTALMLVAVASRLWMLDSPPAVVFDEVHFGRFAGHYVARRYFFDVHPPLAKMVLGAVSYLAGNDGGFAYDDIGVLYATTHENYLPLRAACAVMGSALVPMVYLLVTRLGVSDAGGILAAGLLLFDNAQLTQSRFILLDACMLFFIIGAALACSQLYNVSQDRSNHLTWSWFFWLLVTGLMLGCACACKFVGFFVVILVGFYTIWDLWTLLGDYKTISVSDFCLDFICRVVTLILVPLMVYIFIFWIHLTVLNKTGPGDAFHSARFVSGLENSGLNVLLKDQPHDIYFGSQVTLRLSDPMQPSWLHSHIDRWPTFYADGRGSSALQQVTSYEHKDHHNWFTLLPRHGDKTVLPEDSKPIQHGDTIRLLHVTGAQLLTHNVAAPITPTSQEVSMGVVSPNDTAYVNHLWRIEMVQTSELKQVLTQFRLKHVATETYLACARKRLPEFAFNQLEVTAQPSRNAEETLWHIEEHVNAALLTANRDRASPEPFVTMTFWEKLIESHVKMFASNNALTSTHSYQSFPSEWPFLKRGVSYWQSKEEEKQIYFIGNPLAWFLSSTVTMLAPLLVLFYLIRERRAIFDLVGEHRQTFYMSVGFLFSGWLLHYAPFFFMERQRFLHHYLPASCFAMCATAAVIDHLATRAGLNGSSRWIVMASILSVCAAVFFAYAPLSYGTLLPADAAKQRKYFSTWDIRLGMK